MNRMPAQTRVEIPMKSAREPQIPGVSRNMKAKK
jgi:hypothetical protein